MLIEVFGERCRCLTLDQLIASKRAAGRPQDAEVLAELEIIEHHEDRNPDEAKERISKVGYRFQEVPTDE